MAAGGALALASALVFGAATPLVQRFGYGVGPFATAALLYGGAALFSLLAGLFSLLAGKRAGQPALRRSDAPRLLAVAALGAVVAPVALAWGLQRSSGVTASLLLNLEALFTVVLARALWGEPIGARMSVALVAMTGGGALLIINDRGLSTGEGWGALAVAAATVAWAGDNVVGRPLADADPTRVVLAKGALGAAASAILAAGFAESWPPWTVAGELLACGALGYGASLTLYLRAQRWIGAARTGSIFAAAPFVGAAIAWSMGQPKPGAVTWVAGAFFAFGLWCHLTEAHEHQHDHEAEEHSHAHVHDDWHHRHPHDAYPEGEHTHAHRHEQASHTHRHGLDLHHRHRH